MADGYTVYSALARGQPGFALAHCWAHVRRKFLEIEDHYPQACPEILGSSPKSVAAGSADRASLFGRSDPRGA